MMSVSGSVGPQTRSKTLATRGSRSVHNEVSDNLFAELREYDGENASVPFANVTTNIRTDFDTPGPLESLREGNNDGSVELQREIELLEVKRRLEREMVNDQLRLIERQIELERIRNVNSNSSVGGSSNNSIRSSTSERESNPLEFYRKQIKSVIFPMPNAAERIPSWFSAVESTFQLFEVPENVRSKLLIPHLSVKCKTLLSRLSTQDLDDYETLKAAVLKENKLSPADFLNKLLNAQKQLDETWGQFAGRLRDLFEYYLDSRNANDLDSVKNLMIADYFKSKIPPAARRHVVLQEGTEWLTAPDLAHLVANFEDAQYSIERSSVYNVNNSRFGGANRNKFLGKPPPVNDGRPAARGSDSRAVSRATQPSPWPANPVDANQNYANNNNNLGSDGRRSTISCWRCGQSGHLASNCLSVGKHQDIERHNVRQVAVEESEYPDVEAPKENGFLTARVAAFGVKRGGEFGVAGGQHPFKTRYQRKRGKLSSANIEFEAILDSGCEISVVHENIVPHHLKSESHSKIQLVSAFGDAVTAKLISLPITFENKVCRRTEIITCAVTDRLAAGVQALLTPDDWGLLHDGKRITKRRQYAGMRRRPRYRTPSLA